MPSVPKGRPRGVLEDHLGERTAEQNHLSYFIFNGRQQKGSTGICLVIPWQQHLCFKTVNHPFCLVHLVFVVGGYKLIWGGGYFGSSHKPTPSPGRNPTSAGGTGETTKATLLVTLGVPRSVGAQGSPRGTKGSLRECHGDSLGPQNDAYGCRGMLVGEHKMIDDLQDEHQVKSHKSLC